MEETLRQRKRGQQSWKNNVEQDLRRLLDRKGVIGAFLISKNGETVTQVFQDTIKHKESSLMQLAKKAMSLMVTMRTVPLRRTVFETKEGSVIFYNMENGAICCLLEPGYDIISVMLDVRTAGDMISGHLNNTTLDREKQDELLQENREEFRTLNAELLREIERHFGPITTEQLIQRTVR